MNVILSKKRGPKTQLIVPNFSIFPDGQPHVKLEGVDFSEYHLAEINCSIRNPKELFDFIMLWDTLERCIPVRGRIYWLFGIRMDRPIDDFQPSTFETVKSALGNRIGKIELLDPHNYNVCKEFGGIIQPHWLIEAALFKFDSLNGYTGLDVFLPDAGAAKRYNTLLEKENILIGSKKRNSQTGWLSDFAIESGTKGCDNVLIVDDLCAGGFTFSEQQKVLEKAGYKNFGLYTSHGIYSGNTSVLSKFSGIYSSNSFQFGQAGNEKFALNTYVFDEQNLILTNQEISPL